MFFCIKRKSIIVIVAIILVVAIGVGALVCCLQESQATVGRNGKKLPIYSVKTDEKVVALTFDAAWGADKTKGIIDIMNRNSARGTFFLVGFWIDKYEQEVKLIDDNGFEIGNHSRNHLKMSTLSKEDIQKELSYVNSGVHKITGKQCSVFRPPFGDYNDRLIEETQNMGLMPIQWSVDSLDWKGLSGDEITKRVMSKVGNGSIVLFHNNSDHVLDALPNILLQLKNQGYKFVTVSELIYKDNYTIDNNGTQIQNK